MYIDFFYLSAKVFTKFQPSSTSRGFLGGRAVYIRLEKVGESKFYSENGKPEEEATRREVRRIRIVR